VTNVPDDVLPLPEHSRTPILDLITPLPKVEEGRLNPGQVTLIVTLLGVALVHGLSLAAVVFGYLATLFAVTAIHEIGHLVAGFSVGLQLEYPDDWSPLPEAFSWRLETEGEPFLWRTRTNVSRARLPGAETPTVLLCGWSHCQSSYRSKRAVALQNRTDRRKSCARDTVRRICDSIVAGGDSKLALPWFRLVFE
jgi:hypothetical protein